MNGLLIRCGCSQIFKLFHSRKEFITYLYADILSCILMSKHYDILLSFRKRPNILRSELFCFKLET